MNISKLNRAAIIGAIVTLGIVFSNLAISPVFVMKSILNDSTILNEQLVYGSISCIFWALSLSTTLKYIIIALRNDNNGEGGIFSILTLLKDKSIWITVIAMIGAAALFTDGIMTPATTITASIEGLALYNPKANIVLITIVVIALLFYSQRYSTESVNKFYGLMIMIWLVVISILGISNLFSYPTILKAISPNYAYNFITEYPKAIVLLTGVFLAVTGTETIFSDLGRCGRKNIQYVWIGVKIALLLSYFGQGAWILNNPQMAINSNPFFASMPSGFVVIGVLLATLTAIVAGQAIITSSFILIGEAISLNFSPQMRVQYPTANINKIFIPAINIFMWLACSLIVLTFKSSDNIRAAYGLAANITELTMTILLSYYLLKKGVNHRFVVLFFALFFCLEICFLAANLTKLSSGGWVTLLFIGFYMLVMVGWYFGRVIKTRYITYADIDLYRDLFDEVSKDDSIPRFATNLVYITHSEKKYKVESKIIHSLFRKQPKRAELYWLLHIDRTNEPNRLDYKVTSIIPQKLIRIDFNVGFKVKPQLNIYFKQIIDEMVCRGEIDFISSYDTLRKHKIEPDFRFVFIERIMSPDVKMTDIERIILFLNRVIEKTGLSEARSLNIDPTTTISEQVPIIVNQTIENRIRRCDD